MALAPMQRASRRRARSSASLSAALSRIPGSGWNALRRSVRAGPRAPLAAQARADGVVVAIATITVTAGLAAALVAGASTFLHTASRDSSNKRALAAAQAGLNVGVYRYGLISASPSASFAEKCVTDREEAWKSTSPHCPVATGYLNDTGASSSYYLTPDMSTSLTGMSTVATECASSGAGDRCLTAIGTVSGVTRRVQERVRVLELFTIHGLLGLEKTQINSSESWGGKNFQITSDTGSNGPITFGNNVNAPGAPYHCEVGPAAPEPPNRTVRFANTRERDCS